jgi:hypothetical protein
MQFQVPQFIDVEDKIIGPLSFKQFAYVLASAASAFICLRVLPIWFGGPLMIILISFFLALAFYKVNGRPFINALEAGIMFYFGSRLYVWKQPKAKKEEAGKTKDADDLSNFNYIPRLTNSRLKDLSWSLDVIDLEKRREKQ